jgi:hypothetical protein
MVWRVLFLFSVQYCFNTLGFSTLPVTCSVKPRVSCWRNFHRSDGVFGKFNKCRNSGIRCGVSPFVMGEQNFLPVEVLGIGQLKVLNCFTTLIFYAMYHANLLDTSCPKSTPGSLRAWAVQLSRFSPCGGRGRCRAVHRSRPSSTTGHQSNPDPHSHRRCVTSDSTSTGIQALRAASGRPHHLHNAPPRPQRTSPLCGASPTFCSQVRLQRMGGAQPHGRRAPR